MDSVGAADLRSVFKLERAPLQHFHERFDFRLSRRSQASRRSSALAVSTTSEDVRSVVNKTSGLADIFREVGGESDYVVVGRLFNFVDPLD